MQSGLPVDALKEFDRKLHAVFGRLNGGLAPSALMGTYLDWFMHLMVAPGKQVELASQAIEAWVDHVAYAARCATGREEDPCRCALPQDNRFRAPEWQTYPFNVFAHGFLAVEQWWEAATTDVRGVSERHQAMATFAARQMLDTVAPSNFVPTNPQVLARIRATAGASLARGFANLLEDQRRLVSGRPPAGTEAYRVGETVAVTPGKVVHRTPLAEIIQYSPGHRAGPAGTDRHRPGVDHEVLHPRPVAAELAGEVSHRAGLHGVHGVVEESRQRRPRPRLRRLPPAGRTCRPSTPRPPSPEHKRCTRSATASAARCCRPRSPPWRATATTASPPSAFSPRRPTSREAGELRLFINESQVAFLEDMMWERGYLDARQMAGTFQLLRSNDLIWSRVVREYLLGERSTSIDIMAWNADTTRMPYRMHSEYLRRLFLNNDLAEGRFKVDGRPVSVARHPRSDLRGRHRIGSRRTLAFGVQVPLLWPTPTSTFVLTNGGHNAGILSEPGHPHRRFRIATHRHDDRYVDPESWLAANPPRDGSWWPAWTDWLAERSGPPVAPPSLGLPGTSFAPLEPAPGRYVLMP